MLKKSIFTAVLLLNVIAQPLSAQDQPALVLATEDKQIINSVMQKVGNLDIERHLSTGNDDLGAFFSSIQNSGAPLVVIQSLVTPPDQQKFNKAVSALGKRPGNATYMLFVDQATNVNWVSKVDIPDNLKVVVSVRSLDQEAVAHAFEHAGLNYDGANVTYNYGAAASMAIQQISGIEFEPGRFQTKDWTSGKSTPFFDQSVVATGAPTELSKSIVDFVSGDTIKLPDQWSTITGVTIVDHLTSAVEYDMDAVRFITAKENCSGSDPWDGLIDNGFEFMAFGANK